MSIEFRCTSCRKLLRVKDDAALRQAKCPECATVLDVPAESTDAPVRRPPSPAPAPPPSIAPPTADDDVQHESTPSGDLEPYQPPAASNVGREVARDNGSEHRSAAVTAVAIASFVIGGLQLAFGAFFTLRDGVGTDPVGVVLGLATILGGYGVLGRRPWGRGLALLLGATSGVFAVVNLTTPNILGVVVYGGYAMFVYTVLLTEQAAEEFG